MMNPQGFWMQRCEIENWASEKLVSISKHLRACCSAIKTQHTHHLFCGLSRPLSVTATIDEGIGSKKSSSLLVQSHSFNQESSIQAKLERRNAYTVTLLNYATALPPPAQLVLQV
ncbi:hypothetical protein AAC387_Pa01g2272 [Persea americana]